MVVAWEQHAPQNFKIVSYTDPAQIAYLQTLDGRRQIALKEYTGGESLWFNNYLRGIRLHELNNDARAQLKRKVNALNSLISNAPISKKNMIVFRAVSEDTPSLGFQNYRKGDDADFLSKGLVSTSLSAGAAWNFLEEGDTCCFLVLLLPKGTKMLNVMPTSQFDYEKEILLPHGSKFKIMKDATINGIKTFYCALVGQAHHI